MFEDFAAMSPFAALKHLLSPLSEKYNIYVVRIDLEAGQGLETMIKPPQLTSVSDLSKITLVKPYGAGYNAGLQAHDRIFAVNNIIFRELTKTQRELFFGKSRPRTLELVILRNKTLRLPPYHTAEMFEHVVSNINYQLENLPRYDSFSSLSTISSFDRDATPFEQSILADLPITPPVNSHLSSQIFRG